MSGVGEGTIAKAMRILDLVTKNGTPVRFSEIVSESSYPRATVYRFLQTLTKEGLLKFDEETHQYAPGLRLLAFAHSAWKGASLAPIARPFIDQIAALSDHTVHLAQMERGHVIYVDKRNAQSPVEMFSQAGKIGPGYCTGVGKAIMAFLPKRERDAAVAMQSFYKHTENTIIAKSELFTELKDIKRDGVAYDREEHERGIICVAMPILNSCDIAIGAVSITGTTQKTTLKDLASFSNELRKCADEIANVARISQFPQHMEGR